MDDPSNFIALDVGDKRIGVAVAGAVARLPRPIEALERHEDVLEQLKKLIREEQAGTIVVGLPRGLNGQETKQTERTREFISLLEKELDIPVRPQDEALTSLKAEAELESRGKPYKRGEVDSLAATYILEDYLQQRGAED